MEHKYQSNGRSAPCFHASQTNNSYPTQSLLEFWRMGFFYWFRLRYISVNEHTNEFRFRDYNSTLFVYVPQNRSLIFLMTLLRGSVCVLITTFRISLHQYLSACSGVTLQFAMIRAQTEFGHRSYKPWISFLKNLSRLNNFVFTHALTINLFELCVFCSAMFSGSASTTGWEKANTFEIESCCCTASDDDVTSGFAL